MGRRMAKDTRTRMLETTARLLQHRGYHGTALSDILEASGAPRGSLYFHFPSGKDQLVVEATRLAVEQTSHFLRETLATDRRLKESRISEEAPIVTELVLRWAVPAQEAA